MTAHVVSRGDQVKLALTGKTANSLEKIKKISCATLLGRFNTQRVAGLNALTTQLKKQ
jgi:hypothetical protein